MSYPTIGPVAIRERPFRYLQTLFLAGIMSMQAANSTAGGELAEFQRQIRVKYDMKEAAFAANDPEPIIARFYHPDVISTGPDGVTHLGREELRPVYDEVIASEVRIESFRSLVSGNAGWDWVNFHVKPPEESGQEPFTFKMLFLWGKEDGEWWSHGEMYVVGEFDID